MPRYTVQPSILLVTVQWNSIIQDNVDKSKEYKAELEVFIFNLP